MSSEFFHFKPVADEKAVVKAGHYRVTILTSKCIRIEYSLNNIFKDVPTLTFTIRDLNKVPQYSTKTTEKKLEITTDDLELIIENFDLFPTKENENIKIKGGKLDIDWKYGDDDTEHNLKGTTRTLDTIAGSCPLTQGLISTSGYAVIDDSLAPIINENGTFTPAFELMSILKGEKTAEKTKVPPKVVVDGENIELDLYFFGYGHNYNECIKDFLRISAQPPMLPRFAYGIWWSRYWPYTQEQILSITDDFLAHGVPLKVFVIDMDWHIVKNTGNASNGWTGYTFNNELIPDPPGLIKQLHDRGLKVTFNLHPADGVWSHESAYKEFCEKMGVEPHPQGHIEFDCEDPKFMKHYFELLHHPLEDIGVDFWWIDWQQGTGHNVDPLIVLNHDHFMDSGRNKNRRPFILSRWCGFGGQRYPIGFSGDTEIEWVSLQFQPYFTATASNVGFGFWSHDIGGHMGGHENGELYVRWIQYGALSPILRMHSTFNDFLQRLPWQYDKEIERLAINALNFHHELTPLFYSLGYLYHKEGLMPVRPTYYLAPDEVSAYNCPTQYLLGDDIIVSPFVTPRETLVNLSKTPVWLPPTNNQTSKMSDCWYDFQSGRQYTSGWHMIHGDLHQIPILVRGGGIVPTEVKDILTLNVFPCGNSSFKLYEDDGISSIDEDPRHQNVHNNRSYHITHIKTKYEDKSMTVSFESEGVLEGIVDKNREVHLKIRNVHKDTQVKSKNIEVLSTEHGGNDLVVKIRIQNYPCEVELTNGQPIAIDRTGFTNDLIFDYMKRCNINTFAKKYAYEVLTTNSKSKQIEEIINMNFLDEDIRIDLLSEIGDFGYYHYTQEMGKNVVVVWNTGDSEYFQYVFRKFPLIEENKKLSGQGKVPKALVYEVDKNQSEIQLNWPRYDKVESHLELRFGDLINRKIDFEKLVFIKNK